MKRLICFLISVFAAIGAINWGLIAFLKFNLVEYIEMITGNNGVDVVIYGLVALSGVLVLIKAIIKLVKSCGCGCCSNSGCNCK